MYSLAEIIISTKFERIDYGASCAQYGAEGGLKKIKKEVKGEAGAI